MPQSDVTLKNIKNVEVFSVGEWNGDDFTIDNLKDMVRAFEDNKIGVRPYIKLGHDEKQTILQKDGLPSAGWVDRLWINGNKLMADFVDIPKKVYDLIIRKAYRKVSGEVFFNVKIGEKKYSRMLAGVALLGSDLPGVMNLNDILSLYSITEENYEKISVFTNDKFEFEPSSSEQKKGKVMEKTPLEEKLEQEITKKDFTLKEQAEKLEAAEKAAKESESVLAELKEFKAKAEKEKQELLAKVESERVEKFVTSLQTDKLCSAAMKPLVIDLLGETKKEYSVQDKKLTKEELVKELFKMFKAASEVNFEESSEDSKKTFAKNNADEIDKKAKEYMKENKCSYGVAMKALMKEEKKG